MTAKPCRVCVHPEEGLISRLEAVMNSMRNGLGMRKTGDRRKPGQPDNPHSNAVFTQVHNTLYSLRGSLRARW